MAHAMKSERAETDESGEGLYPIRTVSALTGVNPVTLRAWERRYNLIRPERTPKGHRLYTGEHIALIRHVVSLLEQGISVGQVKRMLAKEGNGEVVPTKEVDTWVQWKDRMLGAVEKFDNQGLDQCYNEVLSLYPVDVVTNRLVLPVLRTLGERWKGQQAGIAEEHFFVTYLRHKLGARFHHLGAKEKGPKLLTACLPGEFHETGLLLFCLSAVNAGYRLIMLGANMPLEQLPWVVERAACDAIVLSGSSKPRAQVLEKQLPALVQEVPVPVFLGGTLSETRREAIESAGAVPLGSPIQPALHLLAGHL